MKLLKMVLFTAMTIVLIASVSSASDFDWARDLNIQAQANPSGFRARLATRFNIGDLQVKTVLSNFENPADAYITLRLGEISGRPTDYVIARYRSGKKKGWGSLAKNLGIKPGSEEFHALKRGHDLNSRFAHGHVSQTGYDYDHFNYADDDHGKKKGNGKLKGKNK